MAILVNMKRNLCLYKMWFHRYSTFHIFEAIFCPFWPKLAISGRKFIFFHLNIQNYNRNVVILVNMKLNRVQYGMWLHRYRIIHVFKATFGHCWPKLALLRSILSIFEIAIEIRLFWSIWGVNLVYMTCGSTDIAYFTYLEPLFGRFGQNWPF